MGVVAFRRKALTAKAALVHLERVAARHPSGVVEVASVTELGQLLGWQRSRTSKQLTAWKRSGKVVVDRTDTGRLAIRVMPPRDALARSGSSKNTALPRAAKRARKRDGNRAERNDSDRVIPPNSTDRETTYPNQVKTSRGRLMAQTAEYAKPVSEYSDTSAEKAPDVPVERGSDDRAPQYPAQGKSYGWVRYHDGGGAGFDAIDSFKKASWPEQLLIAIAAGLSATAAYVSVNGMLTLFPGGASTIMILGALIEGAKFIGTAVVSAGWRSYSFLSKSVVALLLLTAATINATATYGWLISSHVAPAASRTAEYTQVDAGRGADQEVAAGRLADTDRRIQTLDRVRRLTRAQRQERDSLVADRERARRELADTRAGRTTLAASHTADESAAVPIRYATQLGVDVGLLKPNADPEMLMRWLGLAILACGDPMALCCLWMIGSRYRRRRGGA